MSVIHLIVNECGIELEDNDTIERPLLVRVTGRAHDALMILREAIAMIEIDDVKNMHQRAVLCAAAGTLRAAISEVDHT